MAKQIFTDPSEFDDWLGEDFEYTSEDFDVDEFAVLPLRDTVVFPHMVAPLFVGRDRSVRAIEAAMAENQRLVVIAQRDEEKEEPSGSDLYSIGTEVVIGRKLRMPDGTTSVWVQGQRRVQVLRYTQVQPFLRAEVTPVREEAEEGLPTEALMRAVLALFEKVVQYSRNIPDDAYVAAMNAEEPGWLADLTVLGLPQGIASNHLQEEILQGAGECTGTIVQGEIAWRKPAVID